MLLRLSILSIRFVEVPVQTTVGVRVGLSILSIRFSIIVEGVIKDCRALLSILSIRFTYHSNSMQH